MDSVFRTPQVHLIGEIVGAEGFASSRVYCKWQMRTGTYWRLISGQTQGETFYDCSQHIHDLAVFEHPIDIHYTCTTLSGWPKLQLEVWTVDNHGRHTVAGYGSITIPWAPGNYNLQCKLWRPEGGSYEKALSFFLGANPELVYKDMVISGNDRFGMQAISCGNVQIRIGVMTKDFNLHGVKTG